MNVHLLIRLTSRAQSCATRCFKTSRCSVHGACIRIRNSPAGGWKMAGYVRIIEDLTARDLTARILTARSVAGGMSHDSRRALLRDGLADSARNRRCIAGALAPSLQSASPTAGWSLAASSPALHRWLPLASARHRPPAPVAAVDHLRPDSWQNTPAPTSRRPRVKNDSVQTLATIPDEAHGTDEVRSRALPWHARRASANGIVRLIHSS
jgi:hypothetical protein